jgi:hypothetical protein
MGLTKTKKEQELYERYKKYLEYDTIIPQSIVQSYLADVQELVGGNKTRLNRGVQQKAYLGYVD